MDTQRARDIGRGRDEWRQADLVGKAAVRQAEGRQKQRDTGQGKQAGVQPGSLLSQPPPTTPLASSAVWESDVMHRVCC